MRKIFKLKKVVLEVSEEAYDGRDNKIEVTATEDGKIQWSISDGLYMMLTEGERRKIEKIFERCFSQNF